MVDMGNNAEITDTCKICHDTSGSFAPPLAASAGTVTGPEGHKSIGYQRVSLTNKAVARPMAIIAPSESAKTLQSGSPA